MKDIHNIDGVDYIRRDLIKDIEKERDEALEKLKIINKIIHGTYSIKEIQPEVKKVEKKVKKSKKTGNVPYTYGKKDDPYQIPKSAQQLWKIRFMNDFGQFFNKDNRKLKINIKQVLEMQKTLSNSTTNGDIKQLGKDIGLDYAMIHKLAFNYKEGVFDKFIKEWNQKQTLPKPKKLPTQNTPEKRKEAGIYGI